MPLDVGSNSFDPNSYSQIPPIGEYHQIFDPSAFQSAEAHKQAELNAREAIRAAISRKTGKEVLASWELAKTGVMRRVDMSKLESGEIIVR